MWAIYDARLGNQTEERPDAGFLNIVRLNGGKIGGKAFCWFFFVPPNTKEIGETKKEERDVESRIAVCFAWLSG